MITDLEVVLGGPLMLTQVVGGGGGGWTTYCNVSGPGGPLVGGDR